ncbi:hypothetical protein MJA45_10590 [Paenibacillus aurantius]|uniref:Uncharacterized protein n=1 Tax=Paenibacillus aurantius TaxID=2918900 RepID=A0AA96LHJ9_9BACL|nr:hypothetical protein [Paenibacillus aurantius]WNQ13440.1 hypothetical protein MJA45_10590 [Paenibacillus aurantius]
MGTKNILAYFHAPEEAQAMADRLKGMGAEEVSVDTFSLTPGEAVDGTVNPLTGEVTSLAGLTLDTPVSSRSTGILLAAHPSASGMSDGGEGEPSGRNIVLTAIVPDGIHQQALKQIEEAGGLV